MLQRAASIVTAAQYIYNLPDKKYKEIEKYCETYMYDLLDLTFEYRNRL